MGVHPNQTCSIVFRSLCCLTKERTAGSGAGRRGREVDASVLVRLRREMWRSAEKGTIPLKTAWKTIVLVLTTPRLSGYNSRAPAFFVCVWVHQHWPCFVNGSAVEHPKHLQALSKHTHSHVCLCVSGSLARWMWCIGRELTVYSRLCLHYEIIVLIIFYRSLTQALRFNTLCYCKPAEAA